MMYHQLRRLGPLVLGLALVAVACGDDDSDAGASEAVLGFELIQASDFTFEVDTFDSSRGIFRVTTTEPTICSITWGETPNLGNLNNSLQMNGTGIIQHDVFLPGAEPGKVYYFTVQGSTADGQLFQSKLETFTLPAVEATGEADMIVHGDNLALGASVLAVSSEFSVAWSGANAFDGDMATEWATSGDGSEGFIEIDLGSELSITGFEFITRSMADGTAVTTGYTVIVDGVAFGPFAAGTPAESGFSAAEAFGRTVRFEISDSSGGNTGAIEIRVFALQAEDGS